MPYINETIRLGNNTARIKNHYANGLIVIYDINGEFNSGDVVTCDESGEVITLNNFQISIPYDIYYDDQGFDNVDNFITLDNGEFVALDKHFTGKPSQDSQTDYLLSQ